MSDSILPPSSSSLEQRLDIAIDRLALIDIPISTLWNPWDCPAAALPYLAWALSVDQWSSDWSDDRKRLVISNSIELHKIKGTRRAIDLAISNIDLSIVVKEWFEHEPRLQRGTFTVDVFSENQPLSAELLDDVYKSIENVKRKSAHYDGISLNLKSRSKAYLGAVCLLGETVKIYPRQVENISVSTSLRVGHGVRIQETLYIKPRV